MNQLKSMRLPTWEESPKKVKVAAKIENIPRKQHAPFSKLKVERNSKHWKKPELYDEMNDVPAPN